MTKLYSGYVRVDLVCLVAQSVHFFGIPIVLQPQEQSKVVAQILGGNAIVFDQKPFKSGVKGVNIVQVINALHHRLLSVACCG